LLNRIACIKSYIWTYCIHTNDINTFQGLPSWDKPTTCTCTCNITCNMHVHCTCNIHVYYHTHVLQTQPTSGEKMRICGYRFTAVVTPSLPPHTLGIH
jgi:hypothetical protein